MEILIIEDNDSEFIFLKNALERAIDENVSITHTDCLHKALNWLEERKGHVDLIFLDLGLPDTYDYLQAFEKLKPYARNTPIIISTGDADEESAKTLLKNGAEDFIVKGSIRRRPDLLKQTVYYAMFRHERVKDLHGRLEMDQQSIHWLSGGYSVE